MTEVFDLSAAVKPRDRKDPFKFRFGGEEFTTSDPHELDVRALTRADEDPALVLALILGQEGWDRLEAVEEVFTLEHLQALVEAWFAHHGLTPGKSPGSQKSSRARQIR